MTMSYSSDDEDDDVHDASIFDMDHAPPPPPPSVSLNSWTGPLGRSTSSSSSPRASSRRLLLSKTLSALSMGGGGGDSGILMSSSGTAGDATKSSRSLSHGSGSLSASMPPNAPSRWRTSSSHSTLSVASGPSPLDSPPKNTNHGVEEDDTGIGYGATAATTVGGHNSNRMRANTYHPSSLSLSVPIPSTNSSLFDASSSSAPSHRLHRLRSFPPDARTTTAVSAHDMDGDADEEGHFSSPTHAVGGGNHHQQHHHHGLSPLEMSNIAEVQEDNDDDDDDVNKSPGLESVTGFPDDDDENGIHQHSRRRTQPGGSGLPFLAEWLEEVEVDGGEKEEDTPQNSIVWLGFKLPLCCSKRRISWNRVATFVVEKAPCFLFMRMKQGTYRSVLVRLNILCAGLAIVLAGSALWFYLIMQNSTIVDRTALPATQTELDQQQTNYFELITNVWNLNGPVWFLGLCAIAVLVAIVLTVRVVQNVNLSGVTSYLWLILWILPLQLFWTIGLFDYFQVKGVWIKFWWRDSTMAWFRYHFCKAETANTRCAAPVFVNDTDVTIWCEEIYGWSDCLDIRSEAQHKTERFLQTFYLVFGLSSIAFMLLLFLVIKTLESMISQPLVQKSRESNIPVWLLLPIIGSFICGALFSFSTTSVLSTRSITYSESSWIGPLFLGAGTMFSTVALLAVYLRSSKILCAGDKRRKSIAIVCFIVLSLLILLVLIVTFSAYIVFSLALEDFPIDDDLRGDIACFIDQSGSCNGCSDTDSDSPRCPEWSNEDVTKIIQSQAKVGATIAAIFLMYAFGCLQYGCALRKHMSNYMIDYV